MVIYTVIGGRINIMLGNFRPWNWYGEMISDDQNAFFGFTRKQCSKATGRVSHELVIDMVLDMIMMDMTIDPIIHLLVTDLKVMTDSMMHILMIDMIFGINIDRVSKTLWRTAWNSRDSCVCFWCSLLKSVLAFRMEISDVAVFESQSQIYLTGVSVSGLFGLQSLCQLRTWSPIHSFFLGVFIHTQHLWSSACTCRIEFHLTHWLVYARRRGMSLKRTEVVHMRESSTTIYKTLRRFIVW